MFFKKWRKKAKLSSNLYTSNLLLAIGDSVKKVFRWLTLAIGASFVFLYVSFANASSLNEVLHFDIPQQRADHSLTEFARQANITLIFPFEVAMEIKTNHLVGRYSIGDAVKILIENTHLKVQISDAGQLTLFIDQSLGEIASMQKHNKLSMAIACITAACISTSTLAQNDEQRDEEVVEVLGSYISSSDTAAANPVSVVTSEDIQYTGASDIGEIMNTMSVNSGAENRPDTFTSFYSQGTSNVNLRGLGLSSTLVLINGKRQTISGAKAQDGSVFVDTSSIPAIALDRLEVLKEGAAAAYGSDAVAGVVNFVTKEEYEGFKIDGSFQKTWEDSQKDMNLSAIGGFSIGDETNIVLAASILRRTNLNGRERPELVQAANSSLGTSFVMSEDVTVPDGDAYAGTYSDGDNVAFPGCDGIGGVTLPRTNGARCGFRYGLHYNVVNEEEREQLYGAFSTAFGDNELKVKAFYSDYRIIDNYTVPAYPILTFPVIPASHPDNPFGSDVTYLGRINPTLDASQSPEAPRDNTTLRVETALSGDFGNWNWDASLAYSQNEYVIVQPEMSVIRLNAGLAGNGGVSGTETINPFDPTANSASLIDWLSTEFGSSTETDLLVADYVLSGDAFELPGGTAGMAVGIQLRQESYKVDPNAASTIFEDPETGNNTRADFIFLGGVSAVDVSRSTSAMFTEMELPISNWFTLSGALRYENLDTENSIDYKLAGLFSITDEVMIRVSQSTSFREPSLSQFYADTVSTFNVQDYEVNAQGELVLVDEDGNIVLDGSGEPDPKTGTLFIRRSTTGTTDLEAEQATNFNLGVVYAGDTFEVRADYWAVDYEDVITIEDAQGKLLDDPAGPDIERQDPTDPNSELGGISTDYFNAASITARGLDIEGSYNTDMFGGNFRLAIGMARYLKYEIPINGSDTDVSGQFNRGNFARSIPKNKTNLSAHWQNDSHSVYTRMNYVSSYDNGGSQIESYAPVEMQYQYRLGLGGSSEATVSLGMINVFNEEPPFVADGANFSYDPKHHDPRGRLIYVRGSYKF